MLLGLKTQGLDQDVLDLVDMDLFNLTHDVFYARKQEGLRLLCLSGLCPLAHLPYSFYYTAVILLKQLVARTLVHQQGFLMSKDDFLVHSVLEVDRPKVGVTVFQTHALQDKADDVEQVLVSHEEQLNLALDQPIKGVFIAIERTREDLIKEGRKDY